MLNTTQMRAKAYSATVENISGLRLVYINVDSRVGGGVPTL